ncbi:MAG TPA: aldehyde dehydrogenase family protein [Fimbriimonas sp.]|nr:aldehyde dehydrogenase family protein [Fimbriimonas sp.]
MTQQTISPIDGSLYVERPCATAQEIDAKLAKARKAQADWKRTPLSDRIAICRRFAEAMVSNRDQLGIELAWQMGRPIRYGPSEIDTMAKRVTAMCDLAEGALADVALAPLDGFTRFIRREPLGIVFSIVPWNYPYLTAVNTVVPALIAGNAVILKHSPQTPLCAEAMAKAFEDSGIPEGVFQYLHLTIEETQKIARGSEIDFLAFTGSVAVGRALQKLAGDRFIGVGLELGGKDPAYVRPDANLAHAVENLIDGAFFNSGQSCCAIERLYVHETIYDRFVRDAVELTYRYVLDTPLRKETTLGPMVRASSADFVRGQIGEAVSQGAKALIDEARFPASQAGTAYLAPQILVDVHHSMRVMTEESFGPVVGIMKVSSDDVAVGLMNDSPFGLTAAVWTEDEKAALALGDRIETGTWFMNRCDYLDPELPWVGVKNSGRGLTLSLLGFDHLTRPKSFHLRTRT